MNRALVIYNPVSGSGRSEEISAAVEQQLSLAGWHVERRATLGPGGAEPIAREFAARADYLVVVGGDGSVREAVVGLTAGAGVATIGVVPMGNANVVARELGIPREPLRAIDNLLSGNAVPVDIATANSDLFLAMVGVGWDALTVEKLRELRATRFGAWWYRTWADSTYLAAGLAALCRVGLPRFRVVCDGLASRRRYCAAFLCNFRTYSKGWSMTPDAHFQSGRIHFQARFRSLFVFVAWHVLASIFGWRSPRFISDYGEGDTLRLESDTPFPVQIDGDFRGYESALEIRVQPAAVRFVVPHPAGAVQTPLWTTAATQRAGAKAGASAIPAISPTRSPARPPPALRT